MMLRRATLADTDFLRGLRNDAEVRAMSANQHVVSVEEHAIWMDLQLYPPRILAEMCGLFIAMSRYDGPIGMGRIEAAYAPKSCRLHFALIPSMRQQGLGRVLVALLVMEAKLMQYTLIQCKVRRENTRSLICAAMGGVHAITLL